MVVIVEGAAYGAALCAYLREFEGFEHLKINPTKRFHTYLKRWEFTLGDNKDVVIEGSHLASFNRGDYTAAQMRELDGILAELGFKLVWALGEAERFNMTGSFVGTAYFHSNMDKVIFIEGQPITNLAKWIRGESKSVLQSS